jgi:O-antigen/teichoic acid export membrane protein
MNAATVGRMRDRMQTLLGQLRGSDTGKAAVLAGAMIVNNVIALVISVVFARVVSDYGALAALLSYLVILTVAGQAMQVATAREGVLGKLGRGEDLLATLDRWGRSMLVFGLCASVVSVLARQPIADAVGVPHQAWAAAAGIPGGCIYLWLCILRGALQGVGDYRGVGISLVGEQTSRLIAGTALAEVGLGLAGAYLGSLIAYVAMSAYCTLRLRRSQQAAESPAETSPPTLTLLNEVRAAAVAIVALGIIQLLQNVDLITAKHRFADNVASSYAVAAVAAKVMIWVAMGASFHVVPETSRLRSEGIDARPVLLKALGIVFVCALPCMLIFAVASHPLLSIVFGPRRAIASSSLLPLGAAFTMLAATYLAVQFMLAQHRIWFLAAIAVLAVAEPFLLAAAPVHPAAFADVVLGVQAAGAALCYAIALRTAPAESRRRQEVQV